MTSDDRGSFGPRQRGTRGFGLGLAFALAAAACADDGAPAAVDDSPSTEAAGPSTSAPADATTASASPLVSTTTIGTPVPDSLADPLVTVDPVLMANGAGRNADLFSEIEAVAGTADDGPFFMVNLLDFAELAHYSDDSDYAGSSGAEANERYNAVSSGKIAAVGGEIVFAGPVRRTLLADDDIEWDLVAIVRYPSRAALVELGSDEEFSTASVHKWASLDNTFALMSETLDLGLAATLAEPDPAALPFPSTEDDPSLIVFHLLDYHETAQYEPGEEPDDGPISGEEAVGRYSANAGTYAVPLGVRARAWFDVVGPVITDGRNWDEVRLNEFPSEAAFESLTSEPGWEDGLFHRTAGVEETYALMVDPIVFRREVLAPTPG